ncbi:YeeE/YedE family protein [Alginatibacterium sediminis]|uniref:YeeE/YedE family protein n=1 Tax=Alginatibacterium sediminis TaxID=2164068 RepID=A0A420ECZ4_9ALTE|nr:YeeE/YedE family protein [Alginatibacterium sediminis]RKF18541.1 YeeE/YedE family protein [Alginatibacterium sediminis]
MITINFEVFTPGSAMLGGALLGVSSILLMLFNGKVAGISGIFGGLISRRKGDVTWRLLFVVALLSSYFLVSLFSEQQLEMPSSPHWLYVIAGLLVGFGTRIGNGCTSGHGICGIGRLSKRSISATVIFMLVAITVVSIRHFFVGA